MDIFASNETTNIGIPVVDDQSNAVIQLSDADQEIINSLPSDHALLIAVTSGSDKSRFLLDSDSAIAGRNSESDIFLDDITVSRKHAEFKRENEDFAINDLSSLNGTYVNGETVNSSPLKSGDIVQIGKFRLLFVSKNVQ